jgi:membrane dipeptidase
MATHASHAVQIVMQGDRPDPLSRHWPDRRKPGQNRRCQVERAPRLRLRYVEGFDDYGQLPSFIELLGERGYSSEDIAKILGGNYLRVFRQVWGS